MKHLYLLTAAFLFTTSGPILAANNTAAPASKVFPDDVSSQPFWRSHTMTNEPVLFLKKENMTTARLLFHPKKIIRVTYWKGDTQVPLQEGRDFTWDKKSNVLALTAESPAPFKTWEQMHPPPGSPDSIGKSTDGKSDLFWLEGRAFHDWQVLVTYTHDDLLETPASSQASNDLAGSIQKLKTKAPFKLVVLGDSISAGYSASGFVSASPKLPPYAGLVANTLADRYKAPISLVNLSVAGKQSDWGVEMAPKVIAEKPDLVFLAFGMNDGTVKLAPDIYGAHIKAIIASVKAACPECQFVLISPMEGNSEWTGSAPELYPQYRDQLRALTGEGIALADVTTMWSAIIDRKNFVDLTGNGVNHPNDFGHLIYATVILDLFTDTAKK